jgi:hypothetical protein
MPFVTVTAAARDEPAARAVATAIAEALHLRGSDVFVGLVPVATAVDGDGEPAAFAAVDIRGRSRGPQAQAAACDAARAAVAAMWDCPPDSVWVNWQLPT